jgi:hypothetical protein
VIEPTVAHAETRPVRAADRREPTDRALTSTRSTAGAGPRTTCTRGFHDSDFDFSVRLLLGRAMACELTEQRMLDSLDERIE